MNVLIHNVAGGLDDASPETLLDHSTRHDTARVRRKEPEQAMLERGQIDTPDAIPDAYGPRQQVDLKVIQPNGGGKVDLGVVASAQDGRGAGDELFRQEWGDQHVVRAERERRELSRWILPSSHGDRSRSSLPNQFAEEFGRATVLHVHVHEKKIGVAFGKQ